MAVAVHRASYVDVSPAWATAVPDRPDITVVAGRAYEVMVSATGALTHTADLGFAADLAADHTLVAITVTPATQAAAALVGRRVASGFRAALADLCSAAPDRMLRRMLWDLPMFVQVAGQTALLDGPAAGPGVRMNLAGADQCSGWRTGGQMLMQIARNDGMLRMKLGPTAGSAAVVAGWDDDLPPLAALTSRRARSLSVEPVVDAETATVTAHFRDSYADADGVERALHEWHLTARFDRVSQRIVEIAAEPGQLPWDECPWAGLSASALVGADPRDIERLVAADLHGTSTCTHLNDTLRSLTEIPDLLV